MRVASLLVYIGLCVARFSKSAADNEGVFHQALCQERPEC